MEIGVVDDCSVSAMHENTELGPGVLTIICRDCARVIIAEHGGHLLVVCEIDETNIALHSSNRRCQFLKHTRASLPWLIPGLDGLASERIGREILPVELYVPGVVSVSSLPVPCPRSSWIAVTMKRIM